MIRRRQVSFGNPALGTYRQTVYTIEESDKKSCGACLEESHLPMVAMLDVPPEQIPEGILSFAHAHRRQIRHVRMVTSSPCVEVEEEDESSYLVLVELSSLEAARSFVKDLDGKPYTSLQDEERCTVQHVWKVEGEGGSACSPLELHNCAVCLDLLNAKDGHPSSSLLTTVCNHSFHLECLLRWQDSPCPVCRYDHSGINSTLSACHVCSTTENNYVCLICGVVSCSPNDSPNDSPSHARGHYEQTLHAYALHIDSQHVWDFAGEGFVHRLISNEHDGKIVEAPDPRGRASHGRSRTRPGLSDGLEGELVHRKLERSATEYYTVLKSQLEQQRIYYESRMEEMMRRAGEETSGKRTAHLISALKQDRRQMEQRCQSLEKKYQKVHQDVEFLTNMNDSLEQNKIVMDTNIAEAQTKRIQVQDILRTTLPPLREKVRFLMNQLEGGGRIVAAEDVCVDDRKPSASKVKKK